MNKSGYGCATLFASTLFASTLSAQNPEKIGYWDADNQQLPCFHYMGSLPYQSLLANGDTTKLNPDPWFLLGNYQLTLFAHVSGQYELITGQRAWARMNQGALPNSGSNAAWIEVKQGGKKTSYSLTGLSSEASRPETCHRVFGCGYASYTYELKDLTVTRTLRVAPSATPQDGVSAFLLTVTLTNTGSRPLSLNYSESVTANYQTMQQQRQDATQRFVQYQANPAVENGDAVARFTASCRDTLLFQHRSDMSRFEGFPPMLFMHPLQGSFAAATQGGDLLLTRQAALRAGDSIQLSAVVGYTWDETPSALSEKLRGAKDWTAVLPTFPNEPADWARELTWHAYMLEAMATYSEYYGETKIPQGTVYDYDWGQHASARDNFQHALAAVYYHPALAKSILRYMMKRTAPDGQILLIEYGNGFAEPTYYQTSDQQLWFFLLLSEYLRVTQDYAFLAERVRCYPGKDMPEYTTLDMARRCFDYLRYQVGRGEHGLVKLLNSDWNDAVYYTVAAPYNNVVYQAESHMNSAMVCAYFDEMVNQLVQAQSSSSWAGVCTEEDRQMLPLLAQSMAQYRSEVWEAFAQDMGDRTFPRRMYFNGKSYGDDNMFAEPQGFTLQIKELPEARKRALYAEARRRLYEGEKLGARQQQTPEFAGPGWEDGSRENGGFWYSLNGPLVLGVATFDRPEAQRLLHQFSLAHSAEAFPDFWAGYWSASDNVESSLMPTEGLPDQTWTYGDIPIACAHPHAWILYCYYRLKELSPFK